MCTSGWRDLDRMTCYLGMTAVGHSARPVAPRDRPQRLWLLCLAAAITNLQLSPLPEREMAEMLLTVSARVLSAPSRKTAGDRGTERDGRSHFSRSHMPGGPHGQQLGPEY